MSGFGQDGSRGPTEQEAEDYYKQVVLHSSALQKSPELAQLSALPPTRPTPLPPTQPPPQQAAKKAQTKEPRAFHYGKANPPVYLHFSPSEAIDERDLLRQAAVRAQKKTIEDDIARARARQRAWACKREYEKAWSDAYGPSLTQQGYPKDYMSHSVYHHLEGSQCEGHVTADGEIGGCALGIPDFFDSHKLPEAADRLSRLPRPIGFRPTEQQTAQHTEQNTEQHTEQHTEQQTGQQNSEGHQPRQLSVSDLPMSMRRGLPEAVANSLEPFQKEAPKQPSARALLAQLVESQNSGHRGTSSQDAGSQNASLRGPRSQKASSEVSSTQDVRSHGTGSRKTSFQAGSMNTAFAATRLNPSHPEFVPQSHTSKYPDFSRPQNNISNEASHLHTDNGNATSQDYNQSLVPYYGNTSNSQDFGQASASNTNALPYSYGGEIAHAHSQAYSSQNLVPYHGYSNEEVQTASHGSDDSHQVHPHGYDVQATYEPSHSYNVEASHESFHSGKHAGDHQKDTEYAAAENKSPLMIHGPVPQRPYPIIQMHQFDVEGHAEAPPLPQLPYSMEPPPPPSPPQTAQYSPHPSSTQASNFWFNGATYMQHLATRDYHKAQQDKLTCKSQQAMIQPSNDQNSWIPHHRRQENIAAAPPFRSIGATDREALAMILNAQPGQANATHVRNAQNLHIRARLPTPMPLEAAWMATPIFGSIPGTLQTQTSLSGDLLLSSPVELPVLQNGNSVGLVAGLQSLPTAPLAGRLQGKLSSRRFMEIQTASGPLIQTQASQPSSRSANTGRPSIVTYRGPEHLRQNDNSPPAGPAVRPGCLPVLSMTLGQAITSAEQHRQDAQNGNTADDDDSVGDVDFTEFLVDWDSEDEHTREEDEEQEEEEMETEDGPGQGMFESMVEEPAPRPQPSARALFPAEFDEDEDVSYFDVTQSEAALYHVQYPPLAPPPPPPTPPSSQLGDDGSDDDDTGELVYIPYTFRLQPIPSRESRAARAAAVSASSQSTAGQQVSLNEYSAGILGHTMDKMGRNGLYTFGFGNG
ncbi:hypothetical protein F503_06175 [Ophiostoma piceae UAMH 11346]|uniref:Uncharacterized protein n=1 Tax=Ophiostoma piceae (strain UAMH 11346) TaxID=1262450 RepID=S3BYR8_OPHP1|nr:hypothetical protein F503_06175 [Ophiostoma piceae UAMH 11346]